MPLTQEQSQQLSFVILLLAFGEYIGYLLPKNSKILGNETNITRGSQGLVHGQIIFDNFQALTLHEVLLEVGGGGGEEDWKIPSQLYLHKVFPIILL